MSLNDEALKEDKDTIEEGQENTNTMQKEQDMTQDDIREVDEQEDLINEEESAETAQIEKLQQEIEEMKALAQRTQADFMNYKKRVEKEKSELTVFANEKIVTEMLTIVDNFERALQSEKENSETAFYKGVELILKQLMDTLYKFGLEEIDALNQDFDPNFHHAVIQEEADEPDKVIEVLQKGYKLKDKVIRPSMVKVSK